MKCFVCGAPWHPSTGGLFGHQDTPWCGRCVREGIVFLKDRGNRRWGGQRFYDHAQVPPPPTLLRFRFATTHWVETERKHWFDVTTLPSEGVNMEDAYLRIMPLIPPGHRVFNWMELRPREDV